MKATAGTSVAATGDIQMTPTLKLNVLTFAAVLAASLGSVAVAENMPMDGDMQGGGMREGGPFLNFDQIDADKDGKITLAEMEAFRAARFAAADTNGDGNLSAEELVAMHAAERAARELQRSADMIAKFDTNADGVLSAEELPQPGNATNMFERIDTDKDGAISKAEVDAAKAAMAEHRGKGKGHGKRHGWMWGWGDEGDDN
jgi:Ca2+-binding EF-hand superfamily protein